MKIGINLVGVSYNNAIEGGRLRNYEDAIENFYKYIVEPFRKDGHEVSFYLYSYENEKQDKIVNDYNPCIKSQFVKQDYNKLGGGDKVSEGLYTSASEVIRDGLRLLFEKDSAKQEQLEILRQEVSKGFEVLNI